MPGRNDARAAREAALAYLRRRLATEAELLAHLRGAFAEEEAQEALAFVRSLGYVSDRAVAEALIRRHAGAKARGKAALWPKARARGIERDLFEEVCQELLNEEAEALRLVARWPEDAALRARRLLRRGFSRAVVQRVVGVDPAGEDSSS